MFIVPTETPGIKLINFIPPLINLIAVFIVFSINEITPLIPVLTAPEIAFPILVPKFENVFLTFPPYITKEISYIAKYSCNRIVCFLKFLRNSIFYVCYFI